MSAQRRAQTPRKTARGTTTATTRVKPLTAAARARIIAELNAIESDSGDGTITLSSDSTLKVTHLGKVLFPKPKATKGEVMRYYATVWPYLRSVLADRPLSLKRFPEGVGGEFFFQQKAPPNPPYALRVETVDGVSGEQERIVGGSLGTTLYCTQIGAFECNPWNARVQSIEQPDFTVIDLDPGEKSPFARVVEVARWVKEALDLLGLHAGLKTSGATGLHIVIPLPAGSTHATAERVPRLIAEAVAGAHPKSATVVRPLAERGTSKIYVDYGQNARGKTVASAYSVRARPDATVSAPLAWDELESGLDPRDFTIRTMPHRMKTVGDLWAAAMKQPNSARIVTTL
ncbi:MAG: non-homologous end-joining DNA ligase [Gemmatimonadota bacterium]|nr:non-homologous end-joining DNA ligase [Gemmatimonadota bacterium]